MIEKLTELEALMAAMSGSQGVSELTPGQVQALVNLGQTLAAGALAAQIAHESPASAAAAPKRPANRQNRLLLRRVRWNNGRGLLQPARAL